MIQNETFTIYETADEAIADLSCYRSDEYAGIFVLARDNTDGKIIGWFKPEDCQKLINEHQEWFDDNHCIAINTSFLLRFAIIDTFKDGRDTVLAEEDPIEFLDQECADKAFGILRRDVGLEEACNIADRIWESIGKEKRHKHIIDVCEMGVEYFLPEILSVIHSPAGFETESLMISLVGLNTSEYYNPVYRISSNQRIRSDYVPSKAGVILDT